MGAQRTANHTCPRRHNKPTYFRRSRVRICVIHADTDKKTRFRGGKLCRRESPQALTIKRTPNKGIWCPLLCFSYNCGHNTADVWSTIMVTVRSCCRAQNEICNVLRSRRSRRGLCLKFHSSSRYALIILITYTCPNVSLGRIMFIVMYV